MEKTENIATFDHRASKQKLSRRILCIGMLALCTFAYTLCFGGVEPEVPAPHTDRIEWTSCGDGSECGRLLVPTDYQNATRGYANLSVGRWLAKNTTEKLGSLFVNPGGPGASGVDFLYRAGPAMSKLLDDRYDIVSWDPRGVNGTIPGVDCYPSQTAQDIAFSHTNIELGLDARNLSDPVDRAVYMQQYRKVDAENTVIAELCFNRSGDAMHHVGTATVVRDLELLARMIDRPGKKVNYWGFSYGTIIGSFFVNMFPHRVGNFVIDAVVDPIQWTTAGPYSWKKDWLSDTEKTYTHFLEACAEAGPTRCALSTNESSTAATIGKSIDSFMDELYERPLPVLSGKQPYILTSGMVRNLLFVGMYSPRRWHNIAEKISSAMHGDGGSIIDALINTIELNNTIRPKTALAGNAVVCADGPDLRDMEPQHMLEAIMDEIVLSYETASKHFGSIEMIAPCHHWKARAAERFVGPFNHTGLANDILIIGNTADPVTPLRNARVVNQLLRQSRLVIQDGSGSRDISKHSSLAMASPCTGMIIRNYFLDGVLPPNGIICKTVEKLFPDTSESDLDTKSWLDEEAGMSEEDQQLAEKMRKLGQAMASFMGTHKLGGMV